MRKTSHTENTEPLLEYILSEVRFQKAKAFIKPFSVVGDLGCGFHGNFLKKISGNINRGVGYDISVSNKNLPKNVILKKVDINKKIDKKRNYFDTITALAVLEHVENPEMFLRNAKKMLKSGGLVVITTPHKNSKVVLEFLSLKLGLISKEEIEDHKTYFDKKTLRKLLKKIGFKKINISAFEFGMNILCVATKTN